MKTILTILTGLPVNDSVVIIRIGVKMQTSFYIIPSAIDGRSEEAAENKKSKNSNKFKFS
jgi:hypothetical protein